MQVRWNGGGGGGGRVGQEEENEGEEVAGCECFRGMLVLHTLKEGDTFVMSTEEQCVHKQVHSKPLMQTPRLSLSLYHTHAQAHPPFGDMRVESE